MRKWCAECKDYVNINNGAHGIHLEGDEVKWPSDKREELVKLIGGRLVKLHLVFSETRFLWRAVYDPDSYDKIDYVLGGGEFETPESAYEYAEKFFLSIDARTSCPLAMA